MLSNAIVLMCLLTLEFTRVSCTLFTMILQNIVQSDIHRDMKFYTFSKPEIVVATLTHTKSSLVTEVQVGAFFYFPLLPKCNVSSCLISQFSAHFSLFLHTYSIDFSS